jgi:hypothetical protein
LIARTVLDWARGVRVRLNAGSHTIRVDQCQVVAVVLGTYGPRREALIRAAVMNPGSGHEEHHHATRGNYWLTRPSKSPPELTPACTRTTKYVRRKPRDIERSAPVQIGGCVRASSSSDGNGALWAQRIAGGATAPPLPTAGSMGSGPSTESPLDLS